MRPHRFPLSALALTLLAATGLWFLAQVSSSARADEPERIEVPKDRVRIDDGDSLLIAWPEGHEVVRLLGIDAPEIQHLEHEIPYTQPFGEESAGFLRGCLATTEKVELMRSVQRDPYGRTLAYIFLDGRNYSVLALDARLAVESVSRYGDNGLPEQAAACLVAAKRAGPVAFEDPHAYRARMRKVARWMKSQGLYPRTQEDR